MIPGGLINAYFKTRRAQLHLEELARELISYLNTSPHSTSVEEDLETGEALLRVEVKQPHVFLFLIAGDVFQCLRAALDHAVWRIASLHSVQPGDGIQFPIIEVNNSKGRKRLADQTAGLPPAAVTIIESFQPYNRQSSLPLHRHRLWCLNRMAIIDKHKRITVKGTVAMTESEMTPESITGDDPKVFLFRSAQSIGSALGTNVGVQVDFGSDEDGIALTYRAIQTIYEFVSFTVLPRLATFDPWVP